MHDLLLLYYKSDAIHSPTTPVHTSFQVLALMLHIVFFNNSVPDLLLKSTSWAWDLERSFALIALKINSTWATSGQNGGRGFTSNFKHFITAFVKRDVWILALSIIAIGLVLSITSASSKIFSNNFINTENTIEFTVPGFITANHWEFEPIAKSKLALPSKHRWLVMSSSR